MITEFELLQLEREAQLGHKYKAMWDEFINPFFEAKERELFETFCDSAPTKDDLLYIKLQANVLKAMKYHFMAYIETGELAQKRLDEER